MRVGIDQGGTFTDLIAVSGASDWRTAKVPSTPDEPLVAIIAALDRAGIRLDHVEALTLGTTLAINALLQRAGAAVAYVTTQGFEDIPFIQRGNRRHPYELDWRKPLPFLPRRQCLGVQERVDYRGKVVTPLLREEIDRLGDRLGRLIEERGIEAVAVNFLFAFRNPTHERLLGAMIRERFPNLAVSLSHEVAPIWREYERGLTTIADAYLKPLARKSVDEIEQGLRLRGFRGRFALMISNGGIRSSESAAKRPVQLLLSGLVGGVVGGRYFGSQDSEQLVTLDMGGTSCDIAVIADGQQRYADEFTPEFGLPLMFPTIDVATLGAGGGSIAWIDGGGFLRVGPRSAGASPGPACYGLGGEEPTVTDANLVLGRLDPGRRLGGAIDLDPSAARTAIERLASRLDLSLVDTALAVIEIADAEMANAIRLRTIEVGIDVRRIQPRGLRRLRSAARRLDCAGAGHPASGDSRPRRNHLRSRAPGRKSEVRSRDDDRSALRRGHCERAGSADRADPIVGRGRDQCRRRPRRSHDHRRLRHALPRAEL